MVQAIKEQVTIGPAGRVLIDHSDLPEGSRAEVIVLVEDVAAGGEHAPIRFSDLIGKAPPSFASGDEADAFIRALRNEWDR